MKLPKLESYTNIYPSNAVFTASGFELKEKTLLVGFRAVGGIVYSNGYIKEYTTNEIIDVEGKPLLFHVDLEAGGSLLCVIHNNERVILIREEFNYYGEGNKRDSYRVLARGSDADIIINNMGLPGWCRITKCFYISKL